MNNNISLRPIDVGGREAVPEANASIVNVTTSDALDQAFKHNLERRRPKGAFSIWKGGFSDMRWYLVDNEVDNIYIVREVNVDMKIFVY